MKRVFPKTYAFFCECECMCLCVCVRKNSIRKGLKFYLIDRPIISYIASLTDADSQQNPFPTEFLLIK